MQRVVEYGDVPDERLRERDPGRGGCANSRPNASTRDAGGLPTAARGLDAQCASRDAPRIETIR